MFESDLRQQSASTWEDIQAGSYAAAQRIPFWAWADNQSKVMEALHPHRLDETPK